MCIIYTCEMPRDSWKRSHGRVSSCRDARGGCINIYRCHSAISPHYGFITRPIDLLRKIIENVPCIGYVAFCVILADVAAMTLSR